MTNLLARLTAALADRYSIERELGAGGMATVYLARDLKHDREVAVKVLRPELAAAMGAERFLREIQIAAKLTHPHILPLYDSGEADGQLFYVMPFIEGESLRDRIGREGQLGVEEALQIVREVGSALSHAHAMGLVHRDIKPDNILLSGGHAVVADFGIARAVSAAGGEQLTETGLSVGTPHYMSPEQASGEKTVDGRSDEYALACVLYELLVGQPPFTGPTAMAVIARHTMDPVPSVRTVRNTIPVELEGALMKGLAKVPADRFATVQQFVEAVTGKGYTGTLPTPPGAGTARRTWTKPVGIGVAAAVVVIAAVMLGRQLDIGGLFAPPVEQRIAVVDFDASIVTDPAVSYLGEAIPEFLSLVLTGDGGGPRALDRRVVTKAWRAVEGTTSDPVQRRLRVAERVAATHVVTGTVVQQGDSVRVTASLWQGREEVTQAQVTAGRDSASVLAEQVGVQLLAAAAGQFERLSGLMSSSTEAVQLWLQGQNAYRAGDFRRAVDVYEGALDLDSTFALAAWGMMKSARWLEEQNPWYLRGRRLAWEHRERLPRPDSAVFVAESFRNAYPERIGERRSFELYERAVQAYPDRWEAWLLYGDYLWHEGGLFIDDGRAMAVDAFQRALALDSLGHDESWQHLQEHYQMTADWEALATLPARHRGRLSEILQSAAERNSLDSLMWRDLREDYQLPIYALMQLQAMGVGIRVADSIVVILERRAGDGDGNSAQVAGRFWLVRGQPGRGIPLLRIAEDAPGCGSVCQQPEMWLQHGLFGDLPTAVMQAIRDSMGSEFAELGAEHAAGDASERQRLWRPLFPRVWSALWDLRNGDPTDAQYVANIAHRAATLAPRRVQHSFGLYERLLEAALAVELGSDDAPDAVQRLDSTFGIGDVNRRVAAAWILMQADLVARIGDTAKALDIVRRQWMHMGEERAYLLPARLLLRARLAGELGLRDEAIQAYDHYLALRSDPEPVMEEQVAQVREELAALAGERR